MSHMRKIWLDSLREGDFVASDIMKKNGTAVGTVEEVSDYLTISYSSNSYRTLVFYDRQGNYTAVKSVAPIDDPDMQPPAFSRDNHDPSLETHLPDLRGSTIEPADKSCIESFIARSFFRDASLLLRRANRLFDSNFNVDYHIPPDAGSKRIKTIIALQNLIKAME